MTGLGKMTTLCVENCSFHKLAKVRQKWRPFAVVLLDRGKTDISMTNNNDNDDDGADIWVGNS